MKHCTPHSTQLKTILICSVCLDEDIGECYMEMIIAVTHPYFGVIRISTEEGRTGRGGHPHGHLQCEGKNRGQRSSPLTLFPNFSCDLNFQKINLY